MNSSNILIVDTNFNQGSMFKLRLEREGFVVHLINRAAEASKLRNNSSPNLIILNAEHADAMIHGLLSIFETSEAGRIPLIQVREMGTASRKIINSGSKYHYFIEAPVSLLELVALVKRILESLNQNKVTPQIAMSKSLLH